MVTLCELIYKVRLTYNINTVLAIMSLHYINLSMTHSPSPLHVKRAFSLCVILLPVQVCSLLMHKTYHMFSRQFCTSQNSGIFANSQIGVLALRKYVMGTSPDSKHFGESTQKINPE